VVGVSGDSAKTHELFKKEHKLNFTLLADEKGEIATKFGVPVTVGAKTVKAKIEGKEVSIERGATASRWTFVIGKDGKVVYKNTKVDAAGEAKNVLGIIAEEK
jgi:peroxiredoxin Q/BCP